MENLDLSDVREAVFDYRSMPPDDQWNFRKGMRASGHLNVSDRFLHAYPMGFDLIRVAGFRTFMLQSFSQPFTYGYCYGAELGVGQKRHIQELEKNHG